MNKRLLGELELNRIYQRDCLDGMRMIPDKSIDMILCDLPYGTTACKWDTILPFGMLWEQYERIIKDNGAIVLTASQPFTSLLVTSKIDLFRYEWIYEKDRPTNPIVANFRVMPRHENVLVFYKKKPTYNPQKTQRKEENKRNNKKDTTHETGVYSWKPTKSDGATDLVHPSSVQRFTSGKRGFHPTQKPVDLFAYLIRTYTNEGDIVLDNCMGSGTTAIAALRTGRQFIGFELEREYVEIANKRIDNEMEAIANWAQ